MQSTTVTSLTVVPLAVSIMTIAGILVHDMQIEKATEFIFHARPMVSQAVAFVRPEQHIHKDISIFTGAAFSAKTATPSAQPRNTDDKKYITQKRLIGNTYGSDYIWPSI